LNATNKQDNLQEPTKTKEKGKNNKKHKNELNVERNKIDQTTNNCNLLFVPLI